MCHILVLSHLIIPALPWGRDFVITSFQLRPRVQGPGEETVLVDVPEKDASEWHLVRRDWAIESMPLPARVSLKLK